MHQKTQHLSKRAIKRFKQSQYENSTILNNGKDSIKNRRLDSDLCREALITLQNIFFSGTVLLKETFYKNVLNIVIPLLYNLYLSSSESNFYKENNKCRLELFKVLRALQMNPHITLAFPIQYCLEISHMAAYDVDINIVQEAKFASAELEKIIHPAAPTLQLPRQQESNNAIVFESQAEVATTSKSDKRSRTEEELSQNEVATLHKRPRIIASKCVEIIKNGNNIELIEVNNSILNENKSQAVENSCENVISKLNKNDTIEEELPKDAESFTCKQPKTIASKCTEIISHENTIELIERNNSIMDVDKSQRDENLYKEDTGNILQEQCEIHYNKEENQHNIDIINSTTDNKVECELITHVDKKEKKHLKEIVISCTNETDEKVEEISLLNLSGTTKEIYTQIERVKKELNTNAQIEKELNTNAQIEKELNTNTQIEKELNSNTQDSLNLFQKNLDWHN